MKTEINPQETERGEAFSLWMSSPMPMVTLVKTMEVGRLVRMGKKRGLGFNLLMTWCIGQAASQVPEFYMLPEQGRLYKYDRLAVNVIVQNARGGICSCDIPFSEDLRQYADDYLRLTRQAAATCESTFLEDSMVIGTSAMPVTELDCIVNQYTDKFCNPMFMGGKYRKGWLNALLPVSLQFHHVQMDGGHGARFLQTLQETVKVIGDKVIRRGYEG